jgi:putative CocE/NonD family hydrolase
MWGGSYAGFDQWATLKEFPPHLATIVPAAAAHPGVDFPAVKNIFPSYLIQWLTFTSGRTPNTRLFGESAFWIQKFRERYLQNRPFQELDQLVGNPSPHFQEWLQHPTPDAYLDALAPTPEDYARLRIPILTITGHYDDDQAGALHYYRRHMRHGTPEGLARHYLIAGPWDHAGTRTPSRKVGGLEFGEGCMLDLNDLHRQWYDWTLKDGTKPAFLKDQVAYYVPGAEEWKYASSLEAVTRETRTYYLTSPHGTANDVFHSGVLDAGRPGTAPPDHYVYDPLDLRPAELEREEIKNNLTDQRGALNLFGNGLVYHTAAMPEATELAGCLRLVAWIGLDVPDTDFSVTVSEIRHDGTAVLLAEDLLRARYRESLRKERLVKPGEVERYEFAGFPFFARQIAKGSRLRLVLKSPNSIYLQKNYNSGGAVSAEAAKDARTAHITLYHDADHASCLVVPRAADNRQRASRP